MAEMWANFSCVLRVKFCSDGVVFQHAGENLEERDAAGEGVADGLENEDRSGSLSVTLRVAGSPLPSGPVGAALMCRARLPWACSRR
jgi:hypothetical protein